MHTRQVNFRRGFHRISIELAVMCEETGEKIDDIVEHARTAEKLTVYRYEGALKPADFGCLFKRIDIKALRKDLPREKVVLEYPPEE